MKRYSTSYMSTGNEKQNNNKDTTYLLRMAKFKTLKTQTLERIWSKSNFHSRWMGMQMVQIALEDILAVSYQAALDHIMQQSCSFVFTQRSWKLFTQKSARGVVAALSILAKLASNHNWSFCEWIVWYVRIMQHHLTPKRNELPKPWTGMKFKCITKWKSRSEKTTYLMISTTISWKTTERVKDQLLLGVRGWRDDF